MVLSSAHGHCEWVQMQSMDKSTLYWGHHLNSTVCTCPVKAEEMSSLTPRELMDMSRLPCPAGPQSLARSRRQRTMLRCKPRSPGCQTPLAARRARRRKERRQKPKLPMPVRTPLAGRWVELGPAPGTAVGCQSAPQQSPPLNHPLA